MSAPQWMPLYIGDYLGATGHMSTEEHGAYFLMIMACWNAGGALPNDSRKLAKITRLSLKKWLTISDNILDMFVISGGMVRHNRVDRELNRTAEAAQRRRDAGQKGNQKRWGVDHRNAIAMGSQLQPQLQKQDPYQEETLTAASQVIPMTPRSRS